MKFETLPCTCRNRHEQKELELNIPRLPIAVGTLHTSTGCLLVGNRHDCQGDLMHCLGGSMVAVRRVRRWWGMDW